MQFALAVAREEWPEPKGNKVSTIIPILLVLRIDVLVDEFTKWYAKHGDGRDDTDLRFFQRLHMKYTFGSSELFRDLYYEENATVVFVRLLEVLNEPQV
jgi:hypothetical protein